jgi:DNA-binding response OmpR family regulator
MSTGWEMDVTRIASAIPLVELARTKAPDDPINVILVHSDESYRRRIADELSERGFAVQSFADGRLLLSALGAGIDADIIVALAGGSSKMFGAEFLAELDRSDVDLPVILLSDCQALTAVCCSLT